MPSARTLKSRFWISPSGFSVIELITVMVILAIIGFLATYPISYLSPIREKAASKKVKADIRYAQSFALKTQEDTWVSFNPSLGTYSLYYESSPGTWVLMTDPLSQNSFTVNISSSQYSGVTMSQVNFNGINNGLVFDDKGGPYSCISPCSIITALATQGSVQFSAGTTVTVQPATGMVQ